MPYKIICTGNPNTAGLPNAVSKQFPDTTFVSLSSGYDLVSEEGQNKFKDIIKNFNVFINVSKLSNGAQENLLKIAHTSGMQGHVFNIGSVAEYKRWEWHNAEYTAEKRRLRDTSLELCTEFFKTTHIVTGGFRNSSCDDPDRMDPVEIINAIKYVLSSKVNIPIIGIEKINDVEMQKQLKVRDGKP
jgi:hypothetical protein